MVRSNKFGWSGLGWVLKPLPTFSYPKNIFIYKKDLTKKKTTNRQFEQHQKFIKTLSVYFKTVWLFKCLHYQPNIVDDEELLKLSFWWVEVTNQETVSALANEIDKQWIDTTRDVYQTKCKKRLMTEKLLLL